MSAAWRVSWFRFRATFGRRLGGYAAIVLLIGLVGGLAMGAVAAARRTQSSYPAFLASANASNLGLADALYGLQGAKTGYNPKLIAQIAKLPDVRQVESAVQLNDSPLLANGKEFNPPGNFTSNFATIGSIDGLAISQDKLAIVSGRNVEPGNADEMVMSPDAVKALGLHVGSVLGFGFYTNQAETQPGPSGSSWRPHPYLRINAKLVGIGLLDNAIIQDNVDANGSTFVEFTPALSRQLTQCCAQDTMSGLRLEHGSRDVPKVEAELERLNPILTDFSVPSTDEAKAERALAPESIALGVFGLIAALAALLIASQTIGRQIRAGADELDTLRALGARPRNTVSDGLIGTIGAVAVGALLAGVVALSLSPLSPIGPVRRVYPSRGFAFDWTVLGGGVLVLIVGLSAIAVAFAFHAAPHRVARRSRISARTSRVAPIAAASGLPVSAATGVRFALDSGDRRNAPPLRSAIFGAVLAVVVVVSTITFGASLHTLVTRPALYGWDWDSALSGGNGVGAVPAQKAAVALDHDRDVAAWTGVYFGTLRLDGLAVPVLGSSPNAAVGPPLLSGHTLDSANEVVLGATTLAQLRKHIGQAVTVDNGSTKPVQLRIVGTATMPTTGESGGGSVHLEMGSGALLSYQLIPVAIRNQVGNTPTGPNEIFVRFRRGTNDPNALHALTKIAHDLSLPTNYGVQVLAVQHPAEIINYRSMSTTPLWLATALAVGAISALALTLISSVRRRRRDLALLKTFGFTHRQLAAVVAWQSAIAVGIGTIIGVPAGIVIGRVLWDLFAGAIHAVPRPTVPALTIALIAVGALVLANVIAAIPGRQAARTPTALLLHAE